MPDFIAVIPARAASTRLPGKMLADIAGKPLVIHTAERAKASNASRIIIATDDKNIAQCTQDHGFETLLTRETHPSGTDRLAEVATTLGFSDEQIVVNVQGDEPLIEPELINETALALARNPDAAIATCAYPIKNSDSFFNPNSVKVICDTKGYAMYFSRAPIPWAREAFSHDRSHLPESFPALHHIGMYAYRAHFLKRFPLLAQGTLENIESLEQLRALEHGYKIHVLQTNQAPLAGVDTPEDLERVRNFLANM
ncbi:MAG: 3-deoxy-manno-octulosonate cytidylyltransferase [Alcaligenaceae bacterium]|nr:3-deoxy-manno-octulosonate cytidylyltransferase [Alcaligenaceae bacterium]